MEDVRRQEREVRTFRRGELPGRLTVKKLFGWLDKRYNEEYQGRLEWNWKRWKGGKRRQTLETIEKKEEIEWKNSEIKEQTEENEKEMGNMVDPYYEL